MFYVPAWERGTQGGAKPERRAAAPYARSIRRPEMSVQEERRDLLRWRHDDGVGAVVHGRPGRSLLRADSGSPRRQVLPPLDARTGDLLWQLPLTGPVQGSPISYAVDGQTIHRSQRRCSRSRRVGSFTRAGANGFLCGGRVIVRTAIAFQSSVLPMNHDRLRGRRPMRS